MFIRFFTLLIISFTLFSQKGSSLNDCSSLKKLKLHGKFNFHNVSQAAKDFGNIVHYLPCAVLHPESVSDIASTIKHVVKKGRSSSITIAAKGHSHSSHGQAQTQGGIVINMESLDVYEITVHRGESPYVDVSGGELWINILHECLKHGLAPKSWTDYLYLTVGGTLSYGGLSGQAFRYGPQTNNVYQLEVVTGTGEVVTCSDEKNPDLFNGVLGGLGQFGVITKARIALKRAPKMVKWIRALYSDFSTFSRDQEYLISANGTFDYVEGFAMINNTGLLNNWRHSYNPNQHKIDSQGKVLYGLEVVKYFNPSDKKHIDRKVDEALSKLHFDPSTRFESEIPYVQFLDRVHSSELKLKKNGLWDVPHPWLDLLVPKSKIHEFSQQVFNKILTNTSNGPLIIYPVNQTMWRNATSMVTPNEEVFYLVGFLSSAMPNSNGTDGLEYLLKRNKRILEFCKKKNLGVKEYLPSYTTQEEWKAHFGNQWDVLSRRKSLYDPLAILAPKQRIFDKGVDFQ